MEKARLCTQNVNSFFSAEFECKCCIWTLSLIKPQKHQKKDAKIVVFTQALMLTMEDMAAQTGANLSLKNICTFSRKMNKTRQTSDIIFMVNFYFFFLTRLILLLKCPKAFLISHSNIAFLQPACSDNAAFVTASGTTAC